MLLTQAQACKELNISRRTILNWEEQGLITPYRTAGKHRWYEKEDLLKLMGKNILPKIKDSSSNKCVLYCRVSTKKQAETGNLERQKERLYKYASENGYEVCKVFSEVTSGVNENRREFHKMIDYLRKNEIDYLVIEYKDRLARMGYRYIEKTCEILKTKIDIVENIEDKDLNQEMVEDILAIITSFSAKLYGRRGAINVKKTLKSLEKGE